MNKLNGKVAIISGAASGQGAAEARLFSAEGARVVVTDLNQKAGAVVARALGEQAIYIAHDVSSEESWQKVVDKTLAVFGAIDILINNAGVYQQKSFQETDVALMNFHYNVNVMGTFLGMKAVYQAMAQRGSGAIVNVSSGLALHGYPGVFAYSGSKWMVRGMSRCAAIDLAPLKIRVNTIVPGLIDTPMLADNTPEYLNAIAQTIPAKRLGLPEEIAKAALYLASDDASYVSGAEIAVCGAATA